MKILVAEDEKPLAKALQLKLMNSGFEVEVAGDGAEALEKIKSTKYDLLILDLVMPGVDGFAVLTALKAENNPLPVLVISNLSQNEDIAKVKELGAKDYFIKSNVQLPEIVEYIKKNFPSSR
jgi:DNA-binding response OmpR family regulator